MTWYKISCIPSSRTVLVLAACWSKPNAIPVHGRPGRTPPCGGRPAGQMAKSSELLRAYEYHNDDDSVIRSTFSHSLVPWILLYASALIVMYTL